LNARCLFNKSVYKNSHRVIEISFLKYKWIVVKWCIKFIFNENLVCIMSQPTLRREGDAGLRGVSSKKEKKRVVATNVYLRKTSKKPERCSLWTLIVKGSGVVFMHGEGISTPRVRHKGRQPLTKCAISCLQFVLFSHF